MRIIKILLVLLSCIASMSLASRTATLYTQRGERVALVTIPEDTPLPTIITTTSAQRAQLGLPAGLPYGNYIIAQESPVAQIIGPTRGYPVFLDMTSTLIPIEQRHNGTSAIADFDGDGDPDIFITQGYHGNGYPYQPQLLICNQSGVYIDETQARLPAYDMPSFYTWPFDIDNDGDQDIFIICEGADLYNLVYINDGTGHFSMAPDTWIPFQISLNGCIVDVDMDGYQDVVQIGSIDGDNLIYTLWMNNSGQGFTFDFSGRIPNSQLASFGKAAVFAHDYNGDGYPDLFLSHYQNANPDNPLDGRDAVLLNDGTGHFYLPQDNPLPEEEVYSRFYYFVDTDLDGDDDIIRVDLNLNGIHNLNLLVNTAGSYTPTQGSFPGSSYLHNGLVISDFNLDGDVDIYAPRVNLGAVAYDWYLGNMGNNIFVEEPYALPTVLDFTVSCGLINHPGDNHPDIFVLNSGAEAYNTGQNRIYINDHTVASDDPSVPSVSIGAYPNPFKGSTTIRYTSPSGSTPILDVYNLRGQKVRGLTPGTQGTTGYNASWDGKDENGSILPAGVYLIMPRNITNAIATKVLLLH